MDFIASITLFFSASAYPPIKGFSSSFSRLRSSRHRLDSCQQFHFICSTNWLGETIFTVWKLRGAMSFLLSPGHGSLIGLILQVGANVHSEQSGSAEEVAIREGAGIIRSSRHLVAYTGAGISVESGVPNEAHRVLARLEQRGLLKAVIIQNIDSV